MKYFLPIFLFVLSISSLSNAQGYQIQIQLESAPNKEIYLAHYYIGNIFIDDTLQLDAGGSGILKGDSLLHQGLYKIYLDDKNHFDFLLGADQTFSISNKTFATNSIQVNDAGESEEFVKYMGFLNNLKKEGAELKEKLKNASADEKSKIKNQLEKLTPSLHQYWKRIENEFPNSFLAKFLMSNNVPKLDESALPTEILQNDSLLLLARFKYQQKHFWENFDYTDERFLYTPLLKPKMETWFTKVLYQNYDSVHPQVFEFIENVRPQKRIFQFATSFFLNSSINSNIMGMDALFVDLAKTYYLSGEAFWATDESLKKIKENVLFFESNLIGKVAPNLTFESVDGEFFELHKIEKKRTCVLIYEPNCSHCKVFVPQFYTDVYQKYKDKGLEVFAIYSMDNKEEWIEFLEKHKLWDWINVWDKDHASRFKILYDARKTPGIYVLDENKKIIAKKMTVEQLEHLMESDLN
ncbi:MAG: redoxin domain-containing protein [Bacteroidetes bacterium]|nr:redoxin domain-containing protein [Bacteroidota bacterium]